MLGSWPLALTAYNHGPGGMRRAQEQLGTSDIVTIVRKYNSRSFGFASRNFYVAFLAALEIDSDPEKFFGPIRRNPVDNSRVARRCRASCRRAASPRRSSVDRDELRRLNPSLLPSVWNGARHVPRGFELRVPAHIDRDGGAAAQLDAGERYDAQVAETQHRVRSGETLSTIATRYGVEHRDDRGAQRPATVRIASVRVRCSTLPSEAAAAPCRRRVERQAPKRRAPPKPPTPPTGVVGTENRYVVRRGDTLSKIATKHGLSEEALMELNNIRNRNFVYEGQVLALAASARAAPPVEAEVPVENVVAARRSRAGRGRRSGRAGLGARSRRDRSDAGAGHAGGGFGRSGRLLGARRTTRCACRPPRRSVTTPNGSTCAPASLRQLNRMSFATPVVDRPQGEAAISPRSRRISSKRGALEYHRQLQEAFFTQFRIRAPRRT